MTTRMTLNIGVVILSTCFTAPAHSAAFQLLEQNAVHLGNAYSGTAASLGDASSIFTNPAALVGIDQKQIAVSSIAVSARSKVATEVSSANLGATVQGADSDPGGAALIPGVYYAQKLSSNWAVGLGTTVPFGLKTEYDATSLARYVATKSELKTIDIMPTLAYAMSDQLAVGLAADIIYVKATLDANVDLWDTGSSATDRPSRNNADAWGYSMHGGVHYRTNAGTKLGVVYHAPVHVTATGESLSALTGTTQALQSTVSLPASVTASVIKSLTDDLELLGDATWTRWDRFSVLRLEFANGMVTDTPEYFKNTWRLATGANYLYNDAVTFKFGAAYDKTPVNDAYRTARIPDEDRVWLSLGAGLHLWRNLNLNVGYAHLFFKKAAVNDHGVHSGVTGSPLFPELQYKGSYKTNADIIGLQLSWDYV